LDHTAVLYDRFYRALADMGYSFHGLLDGYGVIVWWQANQYAVKVGDIMLSSIGAPTAILVIPASE